MVPFDLPFDLGNSVTRLIALGLASGFRKVVLLGVDLRNSRYFFEAEPKYLRRYGADTFFTGQTSEAHLTESGQGNMLASTAILELARFAERTFKAEVLAGSASSWLSTWIPLDEELSS